MVIGLLVRVRPDLKRGARYFMKDDIGANIATQEMVAMAGRIVHVYKFGSQYHVEEDEYYYNWTDDMFVPVSAKMG